MLKYKKGIVVEHNYLYVNQEQFKILEDMRLQATDIMEYTDKITKYISTFGIDINYSALPSNFGVHDYGKRTIIGWKGRVSGTTKNNAGRCELYSPFADSWHRCDEEINGELHINWAPFKGDTCTGGGDSFSYGSSCYIYLSGFPKIEEEYGEGVQAEAEVKNAQINFDNTISKMIQEYEKNVRFTTQVEENALSNEFSTLSRMATACLEIQDMINARINKLKIDCKNKAIEEHSYTIEEVSSPFLNKDKLLKFNNAMKTKETGKVVQLDEIQKSLDLLLQDRMEYFV